ncbi:MAG: hypothetical protein D6738_08580 [Acidobacteria bacterium]|nr:MAG: hypothetical protein D6738_08580 [Acidobacteriota bacterium]
MLEAEQAKQRGIYLFTVEYDGKELVHYVGETGREFRERLREHLFLYLNGTYNIYDGRSFASGRLVRVWEGMLQWNEARRAEDYLRRQAELSPELLANIRVIRLWLLPTEVERRTRRLMEGAIARALMSQPAPVGTFHEQIQYEYRSDDEPPVEFTLEAHDRFAGMPERMTT